MRVVTIIYVSCLVGVLSRLAPYRQNFDLNNYPFENLLPSDYDDDQLEQDLDELKDILYSMEPIEPPTFTTINTTEDDAPTELLSTTVEPIESDEPTTDSQDAPETSPTDEEQTSITDKQSSFATSQSTTGETTEDDEQTETSSTDEEQTSTTDKQSSSATSRRTSRTTLESLSTTQRPRTSARTSIRSTTTVPLSTTVQSSASDHPITSKSSSISPARNKSSSTAFTSTTRNVNRSTTLKPMPIPVSTTVDIDQSESTSHLNSTSRMSTTPIASTSIPSSSRPINTSSSSTRAPNDTSQPTTRPTSSESTTSSSLPSTSVTANSSKFTAHPTNSTRIVPIPPKPTSTRSTTSKWTSTSVSKTHPTSTSPSTKHPTSSSRPMTSTIEIPTSSARTTTRQTTSDIETEETQAATDVNVPKITPAMIRDEPVDVPFFKFDAYNTGGKVALISIFILAVLNILILAVIIVLLARRCCCKKKNTDASSAKSSKRAPPKNLPKKELSKAAASAGESISLRDRAGLSPPKVPFFDDKFHAKEPIYDFAWTLANKPFNYVDNVDEFSQADVDDSPRKQSSVIEAPWDRQKRFALGSMDCYEASTLSQPSDDDYEFRMEPPNRSLSDSQVKAFFGHTATAQTLLTINSRSHRDDFIAAYGLFGGNASLSVCFGDASSALACQPAPTTTIQGDQIRTFAVNPAINAPRLLSVPQIPMPIAAQAQNIFDLLKIPFPTLVPTPSTPTPSPNITEPLSGLSPTDNSTTWDATNSTSELSGASGANETDTTETGDLIKDLADAERSVLSAFNTTPASNSSSTAPLKLFAPKQDAQVKCESATVTAITLMPYDERLIGMDLDRLHEQMQLLESYTQRKFSSFGEHTEEVANIDGKFALRYKIESTPNCSELRDYSTKAVSYSREIERINFSCHCEPMWVIAKKHKQPSNF